MSKHPHDRPLLFEEFVSLASCRAYTAPGEASATLQLADYLDVTPPSVLRGGLSLRVTPDTSRLALVPLGGRNIVWSGGVANDRNPIYVESENTSLRLGVIGVVPAIDVSLEINAGEACLRGWVRPQPSPLIMPDIPSRIELSEPIAAAVRRATRDGGIGAFVGVGLVMRFGSPLLEDILASTDPLMSWGQEVVSAIDEDCAQAASNLATTMAIGFAQAVRRLDDTIDPGAHSWHADLIGTLRIRDDLCSATRVLRRLQMAEEVDAILNQADAWVSAWLAALPFASELVDEHLTEVARRENPYWAPRSWLIDP